MSKKLLIGGTGLIGKTLLDQTNFDYTFNSKDIHTIEKVLEDGDEIWLSCLPAAKWLVNKNIEEDIYNMQYIIKLLRRTKFSNIILFSTIDVYERNNQKSTELSEPIISRFSYGTNRRLFELMVKDFLSYENLKIFRLPALFGKHLKKNILYDLLNNNMVDQVKVNSAFQWYDLKDLYIDVVSRLETDPIYYNLFPEPVRTNKILDLFPEHKLIVDYNWFGSFYDYKTVHTDTGYLYGKQTSLDKISRFIHETRSQ
jgi:hypothetical protein